jgi:hypothetical protein
MPIISQFYLSQQSKIKKYATNITATDFLELLYNDEWLSKTIGGRAKYWCQNNIKVSFSAIRTDYLVEYVRLKRAGYCLEKSNRVIFKNH